MGQLGIHTKGPWRRSGDGTKGARFGAVVADHPVLAMKGSDAVEYYGGHLVAESISAENIPLIEIAPELYDFVASIENDDGSFPAFMWEWREKLLAKARGEQP